MYIHREIERTLATFLSQFKCVLVTGARQTGKTTLLKQTLGNSYKYITLDDMNELNNALESPGTFLSASVVPLIIDEVQLAPSLFRQTKLVVDATDSYGTVVLTGSQTYNLMQGVSESLAGRVGILELAPLSLREIMGSVGCGSRMEHASCEESASRAGHASRAGRGPYVPAKIKRNDALCAPEGFDLWAHIQRGSMPRLQDKAVDWYAFYSSYVRTYLERDVQQLVNLKNQRKFYAFMVAAAARTGQLLNASDLARDADIDVKTAQDWLSVLEASGVVRILRPFWANTSKRLAKTPKLYFMDTGLACHLTGWNTAEQLRRGAMAGHMFETFAVSEVLKSYANAGRDPRNVSFYRDAQKKEIDLVIQDGRTLYPVEIKTSANVRVDAVKSFRALEGFGDYEVGFGSVICQTEKPYMVDDDIQAVSVWEI